MQKLLIVTFVVIAGFTLGARQWPRPRLGRPLIAGLNPEIAQSYRRQQIPHRTTFNKSHGIASPKREQGPVRGSPYYRATVGVLDNNLVKATVVPYEFAHKQKACVTAPPHLRLGQRGGGAAEKVRLIHLGPVLSLGHPLVNRVLGKADSANA